MQRAGDAALQRDLGERMLDDQARRAGRDARCRRDRARGRAPACSRAAPARAARRPPPRQLQRAAADDTSPRAPAVPRAPISSVTSPPAAISGRAPLRAATTTSSPGAPGVGDAVDLEDRRLARRSGCRSITSRPPAAIASSRGCSELAVGRAAAAPPASSPAAALVFAAADRARRSRVEGAEDAGRLTLAPSSTRPRSRIDADRCLAARLPRGSSRCTQPPARRAGRADRRSRPRRPARGGLPDRVAGRDSTTLSPAP